MEAALEAVEAAVSTAAAEAESYLMICLCSLRQGKYITQDWDSRFEAAAHRARYGHQARGRLPDQPSGGCLLMLAVAAKIFHISSVEIKLLLSY